MGHCFVCKKPLPAGTRADALYCHTNCRSRAFRQRHCGKPYVNQSADPPSRNARYDPAAFAKSREQAVNQSADPPPRNDSYDRTAFAKARQPAPGSALAEHARRVAMDRQLLAQAPPQAVGYRLVLPAREESEKPGYVPTGTGYGQPAWWTLRPFQLPDDDRLLPGRLYKVVWVDAQGARVAPAGNRAIPCLHYFLGAAEPESERADEYEPLLKLARGTSQESAVREEIVRQRLRAMQQEDERAKPSARPQPPPSETPPRESAESLRKQFAQKAREMEELRRPKAAPPPPSKKKSPDNALLWGGAALLGLLSLKKKNQAPTAPTTSQRETPPTEQEPIAAEPGATTNPESELHEPKRAAEQRPACQTAPAAPAEGLAAPQAQPNPPESTAPPRTKSTQTQAESPAVQGNLDAGAPPPTRPARVPMNEDQAIAALSENLLLLLRLTGPHDQPKA